ncbi:MAG: carboxylesterase/lipase family protein, partial [Sphingomonadales bacterium]
MSADDGISRRALIGAGAALAVLPTSARAETNPIVDAPAGRFVGQRSPGRSSDRRTEHFLGIRYGRAERFRAPRPVPRLTGPVEAWRFGPVAPQRGLDDAKSEDCLFLNVWKPAFDVPKPLPVMVYFHGGAYSNGSVTDPQNDGHTLASTEDVVVVTVNHRLNAFGFLYLARLDPRFPDSGNLGQLDLILALQWIN